MARPAFFDCVTSNSIVGNTIEHFFHLDCLSGKLGHRELIVYNDKVLRVKNSQEKYSAKRCLTDIIKIICYLSVIIPAAFLVAKGIYRHSHQFIVVTKEPSLTDEDYDKIAKNTELLDDPSTITEPWKKAIDDKKFSLGDWIAVDDKTKKETMEKHVAASCAFMQKPFEQDVIAISIGSGNRNDHMWPRPVREEVYRDKSVLNILFEYQGYADGRDLLTTLERGPNKQDHYLYRRLHKVKVEQFTGGFPFDVDDCWTRDRCDQFQAALAKNVEEALASGKKVYLGHYSDWRPTKFYLDLYNKMKVLYPDQIYLLIGHKHDLATMAISTVTEDQVNYVGTHRDEATRKQYAHLFRFFPDLHAATV